MQGQFVISLECGTLAVVDPEQAKRCHPSMLIALYSAEVWWIGQTITELFGTIADLTNESKSGLTRWIAQTVALVGEIQARVWQLARSCRLDRQLKRNIPHTYSMCSKALNASYGRIGQLQDFSAKRRTSIADVHAGSVP